MLCEDPLPGPRWRRLGRAPAHEAYDSFNSEEGQASNGSVREAFVQCRWVASINPHPPTGLDFHARQLASTTVDAAICRTGTSHPTAMELRQLRRTSIQLTQLSANQQPFATGLR